MLDSNPRTKLISLRLSEGEYEALKTRYRKFGARNISDLARLALEQMMVAAPGERNEITAKLAELGDRVRTLESHLGLLDRTKSQGTD